MSVAFLIVIIIHGLIHLLGFAKAFGFSDVKQLTQPVSKIFGIAWFFAFLLLMTTALLYVLGSDYWWAIAWVAVLSSQVLIINFWHDAKFGTFANVMILMASIAGYGTWSYDGKYRHEVKIGLQQKEYFTNSVLTETDIQQLPEIVKKYMRYTGCIGKPKVNNFKIEFVGKIRKNEQSEWMPFTSEQYNFMATPTRLFFMKATMKNLPVAGYHCFKNGDAFMDIRLFSLFKVQFQEGAEMDRAETVTFFNDMCCMAPATLIDKRISWTEKSKDVVSATFTNNGISIRAELYFNDKGELTNFISNDRYAADAGKRLQWATPLKNYKEKNGYKLADYAEAIYTYPDGDLCYGTFNVASVKYNCDD